MNKVCYSQAHSAYCGCIDDIRNQQKSQVIL
jgi:hypothetical protein